MKARRLKLVRRALAILAILVAGGWAAGALAAPISAGGFYADNVTKSCANAGSCSADFSGLPAGKVVIITQASCELSINGSSAIYQISLAGSAKPMYLRPVYESTVNSYRQYTVNDPVLEFYRNGIAPFVTLCMAASTPSMTMRCTIAGQIK